MLVWSTSFESPLDLNRPFPDKIRNQKDSNSRHGILNPEAQDFDLLICWIPTFCAFWVLSSVGPGGEVSTCSQPHDRQIRQDVEALTGLKPAQLFKALDVQGNGYISQEDHMNGGSLEHLCQQHLPQSTMYCNNVQHSTTRRTYHFPSIFSGSHLQRHFPIAMHLRRGLQLHLRGLEASR